MSAPRLIEAPEELIIDLAAAKRHLNVEHSDDDTLIGEYLDAAIALVDGYNGQLKRAICPQTWEQAFDSFSSNGFRLKLPPLIEVLSIKYDDENGDEQTVDPGAYVVDFYEQPAWIVEAAIGDGWPTPLDRINAVRVQYRCGYDEENTGPVPEGVKQIVRELVASMYENRGNVGWTIPAPVQEKIDLLKVYD